MACGIQILSFDNYSTGCYTIYMLKQFVKVTIQLLKQSLCSHKNTSDASCPFTMRTYTSCLKCGKRISSISNL